MTTSISPFPVSLSKSWASRPDEHDAFITDLPGNIDYYQSPIAAAHYPRCFNPQINVAYAYANRLARTLCASPEVDSCCCSCCSFLDSTPAYYYSPHTPEEECCSPAMLHAPLPSSGISVPSVPSSPSASGYDCPSPAFSDIPVCMETANKYITMLNSQELEERAAVPEPFSSDKHLLLPSAESISPLPELGSSQETVFDRFVDEATLRTEETGGLLGNINLFGVLLNADTYETGCSDAEMTFELTSSPERTPARAKAADRIVDMKENSLSQTYEPLGDNVSGIAFERPLDFSIPMRKRLGRNMSDRKEESRKRRTRSLNESDELPRKKTSASRLRSMKNETSDAGKCAAKRPMSGATLSQLDENELLTQVVWKKTASGRYVCPYPNCSKSFERKFNGSTHYATHFDVRKYPCDACDRSFTRSYDLKRHQKLHRRNVKGCSKVLDDSD